jgi:hypothetical protein
MYNTWAYEHTHIYLYFKELTSRRHKVLNNWKIRIQTMQGKQRPEQLNRHFKIRYINKQ